MTYLDTQSGSRTDYLARGGGGISQKDYLSQYGTQTLGGPVKVESLTALRSTPQWLTATNASLASTPNVGIAFKCHPPNYYFFLLNSQCVCVWCVQIASVMCKS